MTIKELLELIANQLKLPPELTFSQIATGTSDADIFITNNHKLKRRIYFIRILLNTKHLKITSPENTNKYHRHIIQLNDPNFIEKLQNHIDNIIKDITKTHRKALPSLSETLQTQTPPKPPPKPSS